MTQQLKNATAQNHYLFRAQALEPRIMFDAAAVATLAAVTTADTDTPPPQGFTPLADDGLAEMLAELPPPAIGADNDPQGVSYVFVDGKVENYQQLISDMQGEVVITVIDALENGVEVISETLEGKEGIQAVYIFAHGESGQVSLGNLHLDYDALANDYSGQVAGWGDALTDDGDLLIYGCAVASNAQGQQFVQLLAQLTDADVAASAFDVGFDGENRNWNLEYQTGSIEAENPLSEDAQLNYFGVLSGAPSIAIAEDTLTVKEDTPLALGGIITVADADSASITVTVQAVNGALHAGYSSITFTGTVEHVNTSLNTLIYQGKSNYFGNDTITITVNDGTTTVTETIAVTITPENDVPVLSVGNITVQEGGTVTFKGGNDDYLEFRGSTPASDFSFHVTDPDNVDEQIIYRVTQIPIEGVLRLDGKRLIVGSSFSQADIGKLTYHHDGLQVTSNRTDSFFVEVADGAGGTIDATKITINLTPKNDAPAISAEAPVFEGEQHAEVGKHIVVADVDDDLTNNTVTILSLPVPANGTLYFDGTAVAVGFSFTADRLHLLTFTHNGSEPVDTTPHSATGVTGTGDTLTFDIRVTDGGGGEGVPAAIPQDITVTLNVQPVNDDPVLATNAGLTGVVNGTSHIIRDTLLNTTDIDSADINIVYTVTELPEHGWLTLNGAIMVVGATFTQVDLNNGNLQYHHAAGHGSAETTTMDGFSFEVRDSKLIAYHTNSALIGTDGGVRNAATGEIAEHRFNIEIQPIPAGGGSTTIPLGDDLPEIDGGSAPLNGVSEDRTPATITSSHLGHSSFALDGTTPLSPERIVYTVMSIPAAGELMLDGKVLGVYDTFTQADVDSGKLTYTHDGSEKFYDTFYYSVSNGSVRLPPVDFNIDITPINDAPVISTPSPIIVGEGETIVIDVSKFTLTDVDGTGDKVGIGFATPNTLTFTVTTLPQHGKLYLDGVEVTTSTVISKADFDAGKLTYEHDGTENHDDSFAIELTDNHGATDTATINIEIAPINDAPYQVTNGTPATLAEGGTYTLSGTTDLAYADDDNNSIQRQYRITEAVEHGKLMLNGKVLGVGGVFTQADLDAGRVTYEHDGLEERVDQFKFVVSDGLETTAEDTFVFNMTNVNTPPELTVPTAPIVVDSNAGVTFSGVNKITITDRDAEDGASFTGEINVKLEMKDNAGTIVTDGTFVFGDTTGITVTTNAHGVVELTGHIDAVNAALETLNWATTNDLDQVLRLNVTVDDTIDADDGNGGPHPDGADANYNVVERVITLYASNINDAPEITKPAAQNVPEDTDLVFNATNGNALVITDVDAFTLGGISVKLDVDHGTLTLGALAGLTVSGNGTGSVTLTGTLVAVNDALDGLTYRGVQDYNGADTLTIHVDDGGNTGTGDGTDSHIIDITVTPVNDAPVLTVPTAPFEAIDGQVVPIPGISFTDPDNAAANRDENPSAGANYTDNYTATISTVTKDGSTDHFGTISFADADATKITRNADDTITITGTRAEVNAILAKLHYEKGAGDENDTYSFTVTISDNSDGTGTALTDSKTININVSGINDAPEFTVAPNLELTVREDTTLIIGADKITVDDTDAFGKDLAVTLSVEHGRIWLRNPTLSGLTEITGDNTSTITFKGTLEEINNAIASLRYQGDAHYNGPDTLTITVDDLGGTGAPNTDGPDGTPKTATTIEVPITVLPVNDVPTLTIPADSKTLTINEDTTGTVTSSGIVLADPHDAEDPDSPHVVVVSAAHGVITFTGGDASKITDNGSKTVTISGTLAEVNAILAAYTYAPDANYHGTDTITLRAHDSENGGLTPAGQTAPTGADTDYNVVIDTIAVTINPVNDAPEVSVPDTTTTPLTVREDTALSITGVSIDDIDGDTAKSQHTVTLSVLNGTITVTGASSAITNNGTSTVTIDGTLSQINAILGTISYQGELNYHGNDTLTVTVNDNENGGATPDGAAVGYNIVSDTVAITVTPVNDAPTIGVPSTTPSVVEDTPTTITGVTIADVDGDTPDKPHVVTVSAANGSVSIPGTHDNVTDNGDGTVTISGTRSEVNDLLNTLVYTPNEDFHGTDTISVTVYDNSNGGDTPVGETDGEYNEVTDSFNVTVTPVNDAPVVSVPDTTTTPLSATEDGAPISVPGVTISDVDGDTSGKPHVVTVSAGNGTITVPGNPAGVVNHTDGSITITGTLHEVNTILTGLQYQSNENFNGDDTITVRVHDNENGGATPAGEDTPTGADTDYNVDIKTITVRVAPVNDAPVITVPATPVPADEGATVKVPVSISDPDEAENPDAEISVTIRVPDNGTVTFPNTPSLTPNADGEYILTGTIEEINDLLDDMSYTPDEYFNGPDTIEIVVNDGNNGNGANGPLTVTNTVTINVADVNDAPVIHVPADATVQEDGGPQLVPGVSISDPDAPDATIASNVTIRSDRGALTIPGTHPGVIITIVDSNHFVLTGLEADINEALKSLTFTPEADFNGSVGIYIHVNDNGNGDSGNSPLTADASFTLTVAPQNDAPEVTASIPDFTTAEDTPVTITGITIDDIDALTSNTPLTVTVSADNGTVRIPGGGTGITNNPDGTITITGTVDEINAILDSIEYQGKQDFSGTDTITITVNDNGNGGSGGPLTDSTTVNVVVTPVTDIPTLNTQPSEGAPDTNIPLHIEGGASDIDGSETAVIIISDLPDDAVLSAGIDNGDGTWTLTPEELVGLTIKTSELGTHEITVTVTASESAGGVPDETVTGTVTIEVRVPPVEPVTPPNPAPRLAPPPLPLTPSPFAPISGSVVPPFGSPSAGSGGSGGSGVGGITNVNTPSPFSNLLTPYEQQDVLIPAADSLGAHYQHFNDVYLYANLPDRILAGNGVDSFRIPSDAFRHTDPGVLIKKEATLSNGAPLPSFVVFDAETGEFKVDMDAARNTDTKIIDVRVTGRDSNNNAASADFQIRILDENESVEDVKQEMNLDVVLPEEENALLPAPAGKAALSAQLETIGHKAILNERALLLANAAYSSH